MAQGFVELWRTAVFSFLSAGAGAAPFLKWTTASSMNSGIHICPVQPPGRNSRITERPRAHVHELMSSPATAVLPLIDMPSALESRLLA